MGQSRGFRRVILTAYLYSDVGLYAGSFLVYTHIDLQAVVESVDFRAERIALYSLILVL